MLKKILLIALISVSASILPVLDAFSAEISGVKVSQNGGLEFSMKVDGAFTPSMDEAIHSGLPATFTFVVELYEERSLLPDKKIGVWKFGHSVKYDVLREEYDVRRGEKSGSEKTKSVVEMKSLMSICDNVSVSPLPMLTPGKTYKLRLKAMLDEIKLPFYLDYLFFFIKLWEFETPWSTHEFVAKNG